MSRQRARETAFQMVFQMDVGKNPLEIAERTLEEALKEGLIEEKDREYIIKLVTGVAAKKSEFDVFISAHAKGWTLDRINAIEKNILRLSLYEIHYMDEIPYEVAVNEGIELAKKYGEEDAYSFVNGILDNAKPLKNQGEGEKGK